MLPKDHSKPRAEKDEKIESTTSYHNTMESTKCPHLKQCFTVTLTCLTIFIICMVYRKPPNYVFNLGPGKLKQPNGLPIVFSSRTSPSIATTQTTEESPGKPRRVIVTSAGRTASTLTSLLLTSRDPSGIFWFEPARPLLDNLTYYKGSQYEKVQQLTDDLFNCDPSKFKANGWFQGFSEPVSSYFHCLFFTKKGGGDCFRNFTTHCQNSSLIVIKYIRQDIYTIQKLLKHDKEMRVIYLIRHPVYHGVSLKYTFAVDDLETICQKPANEIQTISNFDEELKQRILIVRAEDILGELGNPDETRLKLYHHIGLADTDSARIWHHEKLNCTDYQSQFRSTYACKRKTSLFSYVENFPAYRTLMRNITDDSDCASIMKQYNYSIPIELEENPS